MARDNGLFQINDIVLDIPPEQISIQRQSFNNAWQTLRTKSSIKAKSGFSTLMITCNVKFTSTPVVDALTSETITNGIDKLSTLVSQFRVTPFCYVENQFLRNSVLAGQQEPNMALALKQLEIRKDLSSTNVVEGIFYFCWFNYFPYLKNYTFKKNFFSPEEVMNPMESTPWKLLYQAEREKYNYTSPPTGQLDGDCIFTFDQYAQLNLRKYNTLKREVDALRILRQDLDKARGATDNGDPIAASLFLSLQASLDSVEHAKALQEEIFGSTTSMNMSQDTGSREAVLDTLLSVLDNTLSKGSNNRFSVITDATEWKVVENNKGQHVRYKGDPLSEADVNAQQGGKDDTVLLERRRVFDLREQGWILSGLSISFENVLATLPLIGHPYPSYQHIGSIDAVVSMQMETTSEESLKALSEFWSICEDQAHKFKFVPQGQRNIHMFNELTSMCGVREFIGNSIITDTVPGQPGTYSARIELINNPIQADTAEKIVPGQSFSLRNDIRQALAKVLEDNIAIVPNAFTLATVEGISTMFSANDVILRSRKTKKVITVTESTLADPETRARQEFAKESIEFTESGYYIYKGQEGDRNARFRNICEEYGRQLGGLLERMAGVVQGGFGSTDIGPVTELYSLNDSDIFSIERIQEDLIPVFRKSVKLMNRFKTPDLEALRIDARNAISRNDSNAMNALTKTRERRLEQGDSERLNFLRAGLEEGFIENLNRVANFISENLDAWLAFSIPFLDNILLTDAIDLDQFADVKKKVGSTKLGSSGHCYPDFPLEHVVEIMRQTDEPAIQQALQDLEETATNAQLTLRNIDVSALLNPDFYLFNHQNDTLASIIGTDVIQDAISSIEETEKVTGRIASEKSWYERVYDPKILGTTKATSVAVDKARKDRDTLFWADDVSEQQKQVQSEITSLLSQQGASVFHPDDLLDDGIGLGCSIAESSTNYENVSLVAIDSKLDTQNSIAQRRAETKLEPVDYHAEAKHRFGPSAIRFLNSVAYAPPEPQDPSKTPVFTRPTVSNALITGRYGDSRESFRGPGAVHEGTDFAVPGGREASVGQPVFASAPGTIVHMSYSDATQTPGGSTLGNQGVSITIQHTGGWQTKYFHLNWDEKTQALSNLFWNKEIPASKNTARNDITVVSGEHIANIGNTGVGSGAHLHFETRLNGRAVNPEDAMSGALHKSQGPLKTIDPANESLFTKSIDQFERDLRNGQGYSMMRAYPTYRLYFIESDLGERKRYGFDDFFSYSSVKEIQLIRSRKLAADLCVIELTNVSGVLSNRKFRHSKDPDAPRNEEGSVTKEDTNPLKRNTVSENPLASLMLQPGIQIQLRLGYNANPDELETVFNGVISDVAFAENDDLVSITCQSFGVELVQGVHGKVKTFGGFLSDTGRTAEILEEMIAFPEVVHFGRWEGGKATNASVRGLLTTRWEAVPKPTDDNIFAPTGRGIRGLFDSTPKYLMYNSTIWDVFQEMTLRHPSYVAYPVPYEGKHGPRMTMFFGVPDQLYFARDPSDLEDSTIEGLKSIASGARKGLENNRTEIETISDPNRNVEVRKVKPRFDLDEEKRRSARRAWLDTAISTLALDKGITRPFRSYHVLNSTQHILQNSIHNSAFNTFNTVTLQYGNKAAEVKTEGGFLGFGATPVGDLQFGDLDTFTLKCDAALPDEDIREMFAQYQNCVGYEMAKRYCVALLYWSLKEGYQGSIVTIGNPKIKPFDICYIFDEYTDMFGPIEVEQVVHKFSQANGFVTEITPDMVVHVNQLSTLSTSDAMGLIAENAMKKIGLDSLPTLVKKVGGGLLSGTVGNFLGASGSLADYAFSPFANMFFNSAERATGENAVTSPMGLLGTFIFQKAITRTQLAQPFRYSLLTKHGQPMPGGLPLKKTDGLFVRNGTKWLKQAEDGVGLMMSDFWDKVNPNNWVGHTTGNIEDAILGRDTGTLRR